MIGGATQTVRELTAAWEARDIMAREIAVDVASHSPQVDPILDELSEMLADIDPREPAIPYYSATQYDPREQAVCDANYWVDNLRNMVRFAPAATICSVFVILGAVVSGSGGRGSPRRPELHE